MKIVAKEGQKFVLRFDKGEKLMQALADFMSQNGLKGCYFSAIGTATSVELGYFNVHIKEYRKKRFLEDLEIISLTGNGAVLGADQKPAIHAHGSFSRTDFSVVGGHVFEVEVLATCEVFIMGLDAEMKRENNPEFNLNLLV